MKAKLGTVQQISWHLPYDWGKTRKTSVGKPSRALNSMSNHCFKWGSFSSNEVGRAMLPALQAKPIGPSQKRSSKIWGLESKDPSTSGATLQATLPDRFQDLDPHKSIKVMDSLWLRHLITTVILFYLVMVHYLIYWTSAITYDISLFMVDIYCAMVLR